MLDLYTLKVEEDMATVEADLNRYLHWYSYSSFLFFSPNSFLDLHTQFSYR